MTRRLFPMLAPLAMACVIAACGGTSTMSVSPTGPSTVQSATSSSDSRLSSCPVGVNVATAVDVAGGRYPVAIATAANCRWAARVDTTWADVAPGSGIGNGDAVLTVQSNPSSDTRTVSLTVNDQVIRVVQNGRSCSYVVSPTALDLGARETAGSVSVTAPAECSWTVSASESWISLASPAGRGTATVPLQFTVNTGGTRHATVTIAGQQVAVTQRAP